MKCKFIFSILIFLIFIFFQNANSQQDANGWRWLNGQPTGNTINWIQIIDASNIFAVADRGTFMKTTDGGSSWSLNSQVGSPDIPATGGGLATRNLYSGWFFDANTGMVGGQSISTNPGIFKRTTNGGNSWTQIQYNTVGGTIRGFYFINSTTGYFCGTSPNSKLFKTTNQGLTWAAVPNVPDNTYYKVYAFNENKIMLATESKRIIQTINGGATWSEIHLPGGTPNVTVEDVFFKDANTGYVCGNPNYFAYSIDGGLNWTQSNAPSSYGQKGLAYNYSNSTLYIAGDITNIFKSINNGVTWTPVQFYDASNENQPIPFTYMTGISVKGNDMAVVGYDGSVTLSNDGGLKWTNKNYSVFPGNSLYGSVFSLSGTQSVWAGPSYDGYAQYPTVPVLYSSNGGSTWKTQPTSHTAAIRDIEFLNSNTGFITGGRANINGIFGEFSKTTNGGSTWNFITLPTPANTYTMFELDFINANTGWLVGGRPGGGGYVILKTTNAGASFVNQTLDQTTIFPAASVQMLDANTGYIVAGGGLYQTTNGGTNWNKNQNSFLSLASWSRAWALTKDIVYICGLGTPDFKKIARSVDGGQTWVDLTSDLLKDATIFKSEWLNLKHGVVVGANGYSARTTNGGLSWTGSNPGVSTLVSLSLPDKNTLYAVCDRNTAFPLMGKLENITSISLNVNMAIEGFWNGSSMVTDSVTVELRNSSSPFGLVEQAKEVVNINGYATYEFYSAPAGSYYVVLKHRNSLETWSAAPVVMAAGGNYNYDFTTSASQTFGNNTVLKAGKYCDYSGDVDQNGTVDITDMSLIDNDAYNFAAGYIPTDVNGDGIADLSDMGITDNNVFYFISVAKP